VPVVDPIETIRPYPAAVISGTTDRHMRNAIVRLRASAASHAAGDIEEIIAFLLLIMPAGVETTYYPDPDRFDPTRTNIAHLTFGAGTHVCLGMPLARMETTVAINALLDRLPDLTPGPDRAAYPSINGVAFRSPAAPPVEFTAA
jgi:Cytochrome P450